MNKSVWQRLRDLWRADFFSPKDFLRRAGVICIVYLAARLAGLQEFTTVLNGTVGSLKLGWEMSAFLGLIYVVVYLAFVILAPALILAAMIGAIWRRFLHRAASEGKPNPQS